MRLQNGTKVRKTSKLGGRTLRWTTPLVGLFVVGMVFFQFGLQSQTPEVVWWDALWDYRTPVKITTGNYGSEDVPISWNVDLAGKLAAMQTPPDVDPLDPNSVRVIEYNPDGTVLGEVPSQFSSTPALGSGIAVIQFSDSYTSTTVGPALTALGYSFTDVTADLEAGTLDYQAYSFVLIDSFATSREELRNALDADTDDIQTFVSSGGVVMMMAQANQDLNGGITSPNGGPAGPVAWAPLTMKYSDVDGDVFPTDPAHELWTVPNNPVDPNGMGGLPCWEGLAEWDAAYAIRASRCTDGTCVAPDPVIAAYAELPYFAGSFLFTAIAADVRYGLGSAPEQAVALDMLENMMEYGLSLVGSGTPPDPELLWMLDGVTGPNTDRHFYVYFDSWDGVDPGTQKAAPAYVTDLSTTGTIVENEHFRFDIGGFTDWTVKDLGLSAPEVWGPPDRVWNMSNYLVFGTFDMFPVPATLIESGPIRSKVLLSPAQGAVMEMTFYAGAPYYERKVLALPTDPASISLNDERPGGIDRPVAQASGVAAFPFAADLPSETDFQTTPTSVAGTVHAWAAVYDTADQTGYAEIAEMIDIINWGMEQGGPMSANEYDATRLPVQTWSYYFQFATTAPLVLDLATQRFANPPVFAEEELNPTLIDAGADLTVDEGETINFSGWVSPEVENPTYNWDFGDTGTATGTLTPTHAYDNQGVFTVVLSVDSSSHSPLGDSLQVTVLNVAPIVDAGSDQVVLIGNPVHFDCGFTDPGVLDTHTFEWDFDDGDTDDTTLTPSHTYLLPGTYTARCTVTDSDGDAGFDEVTIDIVTPTATALIDDGIAGGGSNVQGAADDITLRNQLLAVTVAAVTQDAQLAGEGLGHVLDGAPTGLLDGLDWVIAGYLESSHTEDGTAWDIHNVRYDVPVITDPGTTHAQVTATGVGLDDGVNGDYTGVTLTTTYDLDPLDEYVTITTVLTNTTGSALDFWFGDVMDFDGTGDTVQNTYIPGVGLISTGDGSGQPFEQWAGQWGTGPEAYALHYEDPVLFYGPNSWLKSGRPFHLEATGDPSGDDSATFVRHLIITDSSGYAGHVEAIEAIVSTFPPPATASPTFTVTDSVSGALLEGAVVSLESSLGGIFTGFTDVTGQVTLDVSPGDYTMRASRPGYFQSTPQLITLPEGGSPWAVQLEVRPDAGVEYFILVVSDGMSWDVLNAQAPTEIMSMIATGAAATHGVSEVPSATATNMRTFDTGAHSSSHGVVGNAYVNVQSESLDTLNAAVGRGGMTFETLGSASAVIDKINNGTLSNYTRWWWGGTDSAGHNFGPDSPEYAAAIQSMSTSIGQIMTALQNSTSGIDVGNVVLGLGSDHGMQPLVPPGVTAPDPSCSDGTPEDCSVIDARYVVEQAGIVVNTWRASGPRMAHVYLNDPADAPAAKTALEAFTGVYAAFTKLELDGTDLSALTPDVFAYLNHPNSGDVIAFVEAEYSMGRSVIQSAADPVPGGRNYYWDCSDSYMGGHGGITGQDEYIPFVLWGDAIDPGCSLGARPNADWAPTITAMLGIDPPFDADGSAAVNCMRCVDDDGDGINSCAGDCDDDDPDIFPGALELCDGEDNDCDGEIDSGLTGTVFSMPDDATAAPGETVVVPIIVTPANGIAVDLHIEFDPLVLQLTDVLKTPISDPPGLQDFSLTITPDNINGTLVISLYGVLPPLTGTGPLLNLEFTVMGAVGATSPLDFTYALINEAQIPYCVDHGLFTVCDDVDDDGDGFSECDGDCDDSDINNWDSCGTCVDGDGDLYYTGCDAYDTISGPDCDDVDADINPGETDDDCDGVDEDCVGGADQDYVPIVTNCGQGECASTGVIACVGGVPQPDTCLPGTSVPEICDGLDNNCDGAIDDGFNVGDACEGEGACGAGLIECNVGGAAQCSTDPGGSGDESTVETCDGVDNDCDASIDEDYTDLGAACTVGVGECEASGVNVCNALGDGTECGAVAGDPGTEICDGLDNNCDGAIDDGFNVGDACEGEGACGAGLIECNVGGAAQCSTDPGGSGDESTVETCDGVDNDCDASIDEDYTDLGAACTVGVGECEASGVNVCNALGDGTECGAVAGDPGTEICDGLDNNCDGAIDDGFNVGDACEGEGACGAGLIECNVGGAAQCSTDPGGSGDESTVETCDGVDNDCDASIDEDYTDLGAACTVGVGECEASGVNVCNALGDDTECGAVAGDPGAEICDGLDNNCDGAIDDGFNVGDACEGEGACGAGLIECNVGGAAQCSTDPGGSGDESTVETCDGVDNDCDASIDEDYTDLGAACTVGVGECEASGVNVCNALGDGTECGAVAGDPGTEICDGLDNNCDGAIDDGFNVGDACEGEGACGAGLIECNVGGAAQCSTDPGGSGDESTVETCDGVDNDCDASIDEDYTDLGAACTVGVGECEASGVNVCNALGDGTECGAVAGDPGTEICDGLDNNCDGAIDDGFNVGDACEGEGACGAGLIECNVGGAAQCSTDPGGSGDESTVETCDGVDNDCDASIDEDYTDLGSACTVGVGECEASGVNVCNALGDGTECGAVAGDPGTEICDGLDNNCDGAIDDGFNVGDACEGEGACGAGLIECNVGGAAQCSTDPGGSGDESTVETCDGVDNDCDASIDEDYTDLGAACTVGVGECEASGVNVCNALGDGTECGAVAGDPGTEICDGLDNNCDGAIDDGFNVGDACEGEGACGAGLIECNVGGAAQCSTDPGGSGDESTVETCDGVDNDCDASIDEDYTDLGAACTVGVGECEASGVNVCNALGDGTECGAVAGDPGTEICDGLDNNCDGAIDDGFNVGDACEGEGACGAGLIECNVGGAAQCSTDPGGSGDESTVETCDGVDNDCDASIDEDYTDLGAACTVGVGECEASGVNVCNALGDGTECGAVAGDPGTEICDGLDNNCDGAIDDGFNVGDACEGEGACGAGLIECNVGGAAQCSTDPGGSGDESTVETCDGVDNDCDASIDEDYTDLGSACTVGVGECEASGVNVCNALGDGTECGAVAGDPGTEACDTLDNDCDGLTDEDPAGDPLTQATTCGQGVCSTNTGFETCIGGVYTNDTCDPNAGATAEVCDTFDNDCDGLTDEAPSGDPLTQATTCGVGACLGNTGVETCVGGVYTNDTCDPTGGATAEVCDNVDNDCDGPVDEADGGGPLTQITTCGVGQCAGNEGVETCTGGTYTGDTCDPLFGATPDNQCDGVDNDCDGPADDDYVPTATACGVGECLSAGLLTCVAGLPVDTCLPGLPETEICDGLDNNCDSNVDEDGAALCDDGSGCTMDVCNGASGCDYMDTCPGDQFCDVAGDICATTVSLPTVDVCSGGDLFVPVVVDSIDGLIGLNLGFSYDPLVLAPVEVLAAPASAGYAVGSNLTVPGEVEISLFSPIPGSGGGTVAWVHFTVIGATGSSTALQWLNSALDEGAVGAVEVDGQIDVTAASTSLSLPDDAAGTPGGTVIVPVLADPADGIGVLLTVEFDPTVIQYVDATTTDISAGFSIVKTLDAPGRLMISLFGVFPLSGTGSIVDIEFLVVGSNGASSPLLLARGQIDEGAIPSCLDDGFLRVCGSVAADDLTCDGVDDDCNGLVDDGYVPTGSTCGLGACAGNTGTLECIDGSVVDSCDPFGGAAADDATCDGIDEDCDGTDAEDYVTTPTTCGVGACEGNSGQLECQDGSEVDTCDPLAGATADDQCNGLDEDCDGTNDNDYVPTETTCGLGECAGNTGLLTCVAGATEDTCDPLAGATADDQCNGLDEDCDGTNDNDYVPTETTCGLGECAGNTGLLTCVAGATEDTCDPLAGAAADDQCNGLDEDCDGTNDNDYVPTETTCGLGECAGNTGLLTCVAGAPVDTCDPLAGATADDQCNGLDEDCDGTNDNDYIATPTSCGVGQCAGNVGVLACVDGTLADTCDPLLGATEEICDGVDNDCNDVVDDGPSAGDIGDEVRFGPDPTVITWADLPNSNVYNVYKGNISSVGPFSYDHICYEPESPDAQTEDTAIPAAGQVFYYLVSALNSCQGEDTLGTDSSGTQRPNDNPCPNQGFDSDLDGLTDINDNCPLDDNPGQEDQDIDGVGDVCDNCPTTTPGDQRDRDNDGIGNICDDCTDSDADGFGDPGFPVNTCDEDNCPLKENPGQEDQDLDGLGDVCDACDGDPDNDIDFDGVCGDLDICPLDYDPDQEDADIDGVGDVCDTCTDIDGDGFGDPGFPANTCDEDNCPGDDNPGQEDPDGDGVGSICDICPDDFDPSQTDIDFDTLGDACDPCPSNPDPACQPCPPGDDLDGDGVCSSQEMPVDLGGSMDYRANGDDPLLGLTWTELVFALPGDWQSGTYGVGYDVAGEHPHILNTTVPTGAFSIYTRATFDVADPGAIVEVRIGADYGDAYVAWLNGTEIYRSPEMPAGAPDWNTPALNPHEASNPPNPYYHPLVDVTGDAALQPLGNVLAVGVWNHDELSDALILVPQLTLATSVDNCKFVSNPDQTDTDGDGLGDACDFD